jgi:hypothetical protein
MTICCDYCGGTGIRPLSHGGRMVCTCQQNPCNDCKIEFRHCPLYPKACERFDEYCKAMNKEAK